MRVIRVKYLGVKPRGTRPVLPVDNHRVSYEQGSVEYLGDNENITLALQSGEIWNLRITHEPYVFDAKIMGFVIESDSGGEYGHLHHLDIPKSLRGMGLGKLCISIFYTALSERGLQKFGMKFGDGEQSEQFLKSLGFHDDILYTSQNSDFIGQSVLVGNYESTGDRRDEWCLYPIPLSEFSTVFFSTS